MSKIMKGVLSHERVELSKVPVQENRFMFGHVQGFHGPNKQGHRSV